MSEAIGSTHRGVVNLDKLGIVIAVIAAVAWIFLPFVVFRANRIVLGEARTVFAALPPLEAGVVALATGIGIVTAFYKTPTLVRLVVSLAVLAVLAIFSVMWRWNDFLWPLIVLSRSENYTLQVGLSVYSGQLNVQWHYILAMTVVTMIPVVIVFVFLQRFITAGIAGQGIK